MRTAVVVVLLVLVGAGCSGTASAGPTAGCGMVARSRVVGLLGSDVDATPQGSLSRLRDQHSAVSCRNAVPGHPERYVTISAEYHPQPVRLPAKSCSEGWVYAGTPDKFTPACQETVDGHGKTELIVRWQPYVMHVTIGRTDRNWAGDPEVALAMSRDVAQHLRVDEAEGDG
jgi:hypothetical protein